MRIRSCFSFGLLNDTVRVDTAKIVMQYLGKGSETERTYNVMIVLDSTTAKEEYIMRLSRKNKKFRPGKLTDTLRVVVYRDSLNKVSLTPQTNVCICVYRRVRILIWDCGEESAWDCY